MKHAIGWVRVGSGANFPGCSRTVKRRCVRGRYLAQGLKCTRRPAVPWEKVSIPSLRFHLSLGRTACESRCSRSCRTVSLDPFVISPNVTCPFKGYCNRRAVSTNAFTREYFRCPVPVATGTSAEPGPGFGCLPPLGDPNGVGSSDGVLQQSMIRMTSKCPNCPVLDNCTKFQGIV